MRRVLLLTACAAMAASPASAQEEDRPTDSLPGAGSGRRPFTVTPFVGWQAFDGSSALRGSPSFAIDLTYRLVKNLGISIIGSAVRPKTDSSFFPLVRLGGDSSRYYRVSQRVTEYTVGLAAVGMLPLPRFTPYVLAGVGQYLFTMNPQATGGTTRYSGPMFAVGGGVNLPLGARAGVTLDVRDLMLASFERDRLDATDPLFHDTRFDPIPAGKPEAKSTVHSIRISVGVSFVPDSKEGIR
jgi:opacity protein-like surface antigen